MIDLETIWLELSKAWLPYLGSDARKMTHSIWVGYGFQRSKPPVLYDHEGQPLPPRQLQAGRFETTEFGELHLRLSRKTRKELSKLYSQAQGRGEAPLPNWFEMTLWRDGRHEMSFTYSAEQEARVAAERDELARWREAQERGETPPPDDTTSGSPSSPSGVPPARSVRRPDHPREAALARLGTLVDRPADPERLEHFLRAHALIDELGDWQALRIRLRSVEDGPSEVFQEMRRGGDDSSFEPTRMAEPDWVREALERVRTAHGTPHRDLTVRLTSGSMQLDWGHDHGLLPERLREGDPVANVAAELAGALSEYPRGGAGQLVLTGLLSEDGVRLRGPTTQDEPDGAIGGPPSVDEQTGARTELGRTRSAFRVLAERRLDQLRRTLGETDDRNRSPHRFALRVEADGRWEHDFERDPDQKARLDGESDALADRIKAIVRGGGDGDEG